MDAQNPPHAYSAPIHEDHFNHSKYIHARKDFLKSLNCIQVLCDLLFYMHELKGSTLKKYITFGNLFILTYLQVESPEEHNRLRVP